MVANKIPFDKQKRTFDVIVIGSGASGSVVARRLSDNPSVKVLLLESGGFSYPGEIEDAVRWPQNVGGPNDWAFHSESEAGLNGRSLLMSMGRITGGSTSINAMIWAHGHREDWDHYAAAVGDPAWSYDSILKIYQRIENYHGTMDTQRGVRGPVEVFQPSQPHPIAPALVEAAGAIGIPTFANPNGCMMEEPAGAAISDVRADGFKRITIFDSYIRPVLDRENLTLITDATVHRLLIEAGKVVGVEVVHEGERLEFRADEQVVLSAGAINTPRILLHSGIGDMKELKRLGIPLRQHLPGVGQNLQDHLCFPSVFELRVPIPARFNGSEATIYASLNADNTSPDVLMCQSEFPVLSPELMAQHPVGPHSWSLVAGLARPLSRGEVRLRSSDPGDGVILRLNSLAEPGDMKTAIAAVELSREIGAQQSLAALTSHEILPGEAFKDDPESFVRQSAIPFWHQSCTAKMGRDEMSVVDSELRVHGISNLTIADGSVFPRIPAGSTMAPCVVVGERAAQILADRLFGGEYVPKSPFDDVDMRYSW